MRSDTALLLCMAVCTVAFFGMIAWIGGKEQDSKAAARIACIQAKGNWDTKWGGSCSFPKPEVKP